MNSEPIDYGALADRCAQDRSCFDRRPCSYEFLLQEAAAALRAAEAMQKSNLSAAGLALLEAVNAENVRLQTRAEAQAKLLAEARSLALSLARSFPDTILESIRTEWGNTNVAVIKHWRDAVLAKLDAAQPGNNWSDASRSRMIVCPVCGNKRCPHATDERLDCTGSNEPGQPGSSYPAETREGER